jgi:hypothetical protein
VLDCFPHLIVDIIWCSYGTDLAEQEECKFKRGKVKVISERVMGQVAATNG